MKSPIVAILLAGGLARRMGGGDKCLREVAGQSLLAHVIDRIAPQVEHVVLNANGDPTSHAQKLPHHDVTEFLPTRCANLCNLLAGRAALRRT